MKPGSVYTSKVVVDKSNTARAMGSGSLEVFATPSMIALMENAAVEAIASDLAEGQTTVGTVINVMHNRATPLGAEVSATAVLQEVDGRRLVFHVSASDAKGVIGEGVHERFVVDTERFLGKL